MEKDTERRTLSKDTDTQREGGPVTVEVAAGQRTAGAVRSCERQGRILPWRLQRTHGIAKKPNLKLQASGSRKE